MPSAGLGQRSVLGKILGKFKACRAKEAALGDIIGEGSIAVMAGGIVWDLGRSWTKAPFPQRAWDGGAWLCASPETTNFPAISLTLALHPMCFEEQ